ncbi:DinB superfamily protein [Chitinophaga jiangningensis]|uniref:DinB superfamily protein n=1 Tax=Chitinophaga jiangningensis TaxID=1419482 RepID=A0A1M7CK43_9BACT|nr:DinB family protein [Chitinophaga jiangningensis]SHL67209.1 DinB superfamily protein [Chitinophaga jiangningensis]
MAVEYWMRGPVEQVPALLQPVAHALLQAREEIQQLMEGFPDELLWEKPAGNASPGFHLKHLTGVLDRLFTYAQGRMLSEEQMAWLKQEELPSYTVAELVEKFSQQTDAALQQLKATDPATLTDFRGVGRKQLPSTVQGLLFHAAEHTTRHLGQLLVTVRVLKTIKNNIT